MECVSDGVQGGAGEAGGQAALPHPRVHAHADGHLRVHLNDWKRLKIVAADGNDDEAESDDEEAWEMVNAICPRARASSPRSPTTRSASATAASSSAPACSRRCRTRRSAPKLLQHASKQPHIVAERSFSKEVAHSPEDEHILYK